MEDSIVTRIIISHAILITILCCHSTFSSDITFFYVHIVHTWSQICISQHTIITHIQLHNYIHQIEAPTFSTPFLPSHLLTPHYMQWYGGKPIYSHFTCSFISGGRNLSLVKESLSFLIPFSRFNCRFILSISFSWITYFCTLLGAWCTFQHWVSIYLSISEVLRSVFLVACHSHVRYHATVHVSHQHLFT